MKRIIIGIMLTVAPGACSQSQKTDRYFNYPLHKVELPETGGILSPERVLGDTLFYQFWFITDSLLVGISPAGYVQDDKFITVTDLASGKVVGKFCEKGRGPNEYLSPIAADMQTGQLSIYDYMTARYSELDVPRSISEGRSVYSQIVSVPRESHKSKVLLSIHKWNGEILAYDAGQNIDSDDLVKMPSYVMMDLKTGEQNRSFNFFKRVPLSEKKQRNRLIPVKERLGQVSCLNVDEGKLCFVMGFIPQINIFDLKAERAFGVKVIDYENLSLVNRVRHYQDVTSDRQRIYALYWGVQEQEIPSGKNNTEMHIFDWNGNLLSRYTLPGVFLGCQANDTGLFLSKLVEDSMQLYYLPTEMFK